MKFRGDFVGSGLSGKKQTEVLAYFEVEGRKRNKKKENKKTTHSPMVHGVTKTKNRNKKKLTSTAK